MLQPKYRVSFEEAKTVFDYLLYVDFYDPDPSEDEERYLIVGESNRGRLLIVSYTERGDLIRLISAKEFKGVAVATIVRTSFCCLFPVLFSLYSKMYCPNRYVRCYNFLTGNRQQYPRF